MLGALFQYSGFCSAVGKVVKAPSPTTTHLCGVALLTNSQVNFVSALVTAALTGAAGAHWMAAV